LSNIFNRSYQQPAISFQLSAKTKESKKQAVYTKSFSLFTVYRLLRIDYFYRTCSLLSTLPLPSFAMSYEPRAMSVFFFSVIFIALTAFIS